MSEQAARSPTSVGGEVHRNDAAMTHETRIRELLEQILESNCSPEEACAACPELLPEVRRRWRRLRRIQGRVDELFPSSDAVSRSQVERARLSPDAKLPQLAGYEVRAVLGHGGMGVVYKAHHLQLHRDVALKMLLSGAYARPQERARFIREAESIAGLQHANIVPVYDVGELDGHPYFTMEFLEGGSLARQLGGGPQSARSSAQLVAVLAAAVAFAHEHGVVHRDLKPANILLTTDGTPKIADFGLARRLDLSEDLTMSGAKLGTPSYMAPEQASGKPGAFGPPVDIYALGAILYEMLTGRPPFRAETSAETERQVITEEPARPSKLNASVPRDLENICLKCLHKDPQRRYSSSLELTEDLGRFLEGKPVLARPVGVLERLMKWARRRPGVAGLVAAVLSLAALAVVGGFWLERQRADQRAQLARQEGRTAQAVEAALEQAAALREQGRWPDVRAVLTGAKRLLSDTTPPSLRQKIQQGLADADMVAELEGIRMSDVGQKPDAPTSPERLYEEAYRKNGITLTMPPAEAAERVRNSAIRDTLIAFLHDWLYWASDEKRERLRLLADQIDFNEWRRNFRKALVTKDSSRLAALANTADPSNQPAVVLSGLGSALLLSNNKAEALTVLRKAHLRFPDDYWINYLLGTGCAGERPQEAVGYFRAAIAIRPTSDRPYLMLGKALIETGDVDGAIANIRKANSINANFPFSRDLAQVLAGRADLEEVRAGWETALERDPRSHDTWFGYPELCLYLGNEQAYRRARRELLERFGATSDDWILAERASVECLLLPDSGPELQTAAALADRAVAAAARTQEPGNAYVRFAEGLANYRLGRYEAAKPLLRDAAERLPNRAAPRLVLAMAEFRTGAKSEALKLLSAAIRGYNWGESKADNQAVWIGHLLRRQAETMILPSLPAFLEGKYQPQDNDERLALLGICQFQARWRSAARLYADAFAADPKLADELAADCVRRGRGAEPPSDQTEPFRAASRYTAARCAASAGCGIGSDAAQVDESERKQWREQARRWLRADVSAWKKMLHSDAPADRDLAIRMLAHWQSDPELAGLRDVDAIAKLPEAEAAECREIWAQVDALVHRQPAAN